MTARMFLAWAALWLAFTFEARGELISISRQGEFTATASAQQLLPANMRRKYILIMNKGTRSVYLKFETAPSGAQGIEIPAGGNYENNDVPISPAFIKTSASTSGLFYMEGQ